jgi:hypothetical protein
MTPHRVVEAAKAVTKSNSVRNELGLPADVRDASEVWVEPDCSIEFQGHKFESGGAVVAPDRIVAYPGEGLALNDWHGNRIGTWHLVATWKTPWSHVSSTMSQIEAYVNGVWYTGRGAGRGMVYFGKRKAKQTPR